MKHQPKFARHPTIRIVQSPTLMKLPRYSLAPTRKDRPRTKETLGKGVHQSVAILAYLANILILDPAYLLNVCGALRDIL